MPLDVAKIKHLFLAALEIPKVDARRSFLESECGTDIELRDYLRGMLDAHEKHLTPFPEIPVGDTRLELTAHYKPASLQPGTIVDKRYKIIELIAEGGMGVVYRANRVADVKMEAALKVIKPGMGSAQVLARFNIERQALAIMKHENIARVFDAGTTAEGLPYFVMELVKGLPITRYCDDCKLSVNERLELFEQVCSAVQHAHQKGIVHRDLKPSNILVAPYDDKPVPKVIDFGLAKALHQPLTDDTVHTTMNAFVGTWQYTAPEQAQLNNLDIDTRADIYSLGVILYELLTGNPPIEKSRLTKAAEDEVRRWIREEDPPKPSTRIHSSAQLPSLAAQRGSEPLQLERQVRGELDWIVMKALEKDRNRRYATAHEFGADLQRLRKHEPVLAGPPTLTYRARKYLRRHWVSVLAASLVVAAISVGAIVSTYGWIAAVRERDRANRQTENLAAVNQFLKEDLLEQADPDSQISPTKSYNRNITVLEAMDKAADRVAYRFKDHPLQEAAVRFTLGKSFSALGEFRQAQLQLEKALKLQETGAGADDEARLDSLAELGLTLLLKSEFVEGEKLLKEAIDRKIAVQGKLHRSTLKTQFYLASLYECLDKNNVANELFDSILQAQTQALGPMDRDTLITRRAVARMAQKKPDLPKAEQLFVELIRQQETVFGKEHPEVLLTKNDLALLLEEKTEFARGAQLLQQIIQAARHTLGPKHPHYLGFMSNLGSNYCRQGRFAEANDIYVVIVPVSREIFGEVGVQTLGLINNQAAVLAGLKQNDKALTLLLSVFPVCRDKLGLKHENTRVLLENIVEMYRAIGPQEKVKEFEELLKQAR